MNRYENFEAIDRDVFSAFCNSFSGINWNLRPTTDPYARFDVEATATTELNSTTYDIEIKSVFLHYLLDVCYLEADKWLGLVGGENDRKIYFVVYPYLDTVAVWNVTGELLRSSERHVKELPKNTVRDGNVTIKKDVYLLPIDKAKLYYIDLSSYRKRYNANHL